MWPMPFLGAMIHFFMSDSGGRAKTTVTEFLWRQASMPCVRSRSMA